MSNGDAGGWELWRQDDNGNRFLIGRFATEGSAEAEQRRFEALAHKQTYWVQRDATRAGNLPLPDGPGAPAGAGG